MLSETSQSQKIRYLCEFLCRGSDCSRETKRWLLLGRKAVTNLDTHIKKQRRHIANKGPYCQSYGLSSSHVWVWELDHKESWAQKNWYFWAKVLEKTLESPLDCKEIKLVNPRENQPWICIRTDAEAPKLWPPDEKSQLWIRPWHWEKLKAIGEGGSREWDG